MHACERTCTKVSVDLVFYEHEKWDVNFFIDWGICLLAAHLYRKRRSETCGKKRICAMVRGQGKRPMMTRKSVRIHPVHEDGQIWSEFLDLSTASHPVKIFLLGVGR